MTIFPMDAVDDVFDGERKFTVTHNMDGTQSFRDTTDYDQVGTEFGALEYNDLCAAIMGFTAGTTQFLNDGRIMETDSNSRKKITAFGNDEHGNSQITETLYDTDNTILAVKTTIFNNDGSISESITR